MLFLKKYGKRLIYTIIIFLVLLFIITLMYNYNLLSDNMYKFLKLLIFLMTILINSFILGKAKDKKGYLEGIKFGTLISIIFLIISLLTGNFQTKLLIYYFIIITTTTLGSMLGISKKK